MRRVEKIEQYEGVMFRNADGLSVIFREERIKDKGACLIDDRDFTYYIFEEDDRVLFVRESTNKMLYEVRKYGDGTVCFYGVTCVPSAKKATQEELSERVEEEIITKDINELNGVKFVEVEYDDEVVVAVEKEDGTLYAPDSLSNITKVKRVTINTEVEHSVSVVDIASRTISKTVNKNIFEKDEFEFLGKIVQLTEDYFLKMYKNNQSAIVVTNDNKFYNIKAHQLEYVTIITSKELFEIPEDYTIVFEKYVSKKKTRGITDSVKTPFSFFKY